MGKNYAVVVWALVRTIALEMLASGFLSSHSNSPLPSRPGTPEAIRDRKVHHFLK